MLVLAVTMQRKETDVVTWSVYPVGGEFFYSMSLLSEIESWHVESINPSTNINPALSYVRYLVFRNEPEFFYT